MTDTPEQPLNSPSSRPNDPGSVPPATASPSLPNDNVSLPRVKIPAIPANPEAENSPEPLPADAKQKPVRENGIPEMIATARRRPSPPSVPEQDFGFGRKKQGSSAREQFFGPRSGVGRTPRPGTARRLWLVLIPLIVVVAGALCGYLKYSRTHSQKNIPPVMPALGTSTPETPTMEPLLPVVPVAEPPNLTPEPDPATLTPEKLAEEATLSLDEANAKIMDLGREISDNPLWLKILGQSTVIERAVAAMDFLAEGERPLPALDFLKSPLAFAAARSGGTMKQTAASLNRYTPLCRMLVALPPDKLAGLYRKLEPALQQAYEKLGYRGQPVRSLLIRACTTILSCPVVEPEEELIPAGSPGLYRWARPEIEGLSKAEKLFLRLGPQNTDMVRRYVEKAALELQLFSE